jgi:signal transduction histidine kinase
MRGYLEVLAAKGDALDAGQRREFVGIAIRQSENLARLIDELFELARLDFKGMTLEREAFDLRDLASDVLQSFRLAAEAHGVRLVLAAEPRLPHVDGDLGLLERVLENLVGNALRHTPAGGTVEVRLARRDDGVDVVVHDDGSGIGEDDLPHVFERHWRGGSGGGAGLGLAITRRILELHGASITVASAPGEGTSFAFSLARAKQGGVRQAAA